MGKPTKARPAAHRAFKRVQPFPAMNRARTDHKLYNPLPHSATNRNVDFWQKYREAPMVARVKRRLQENRAGPRRINEETG